VGSWADQIATGLRRGFRSRRRPEESPHVGPFEKLSPLLPVADGAPAHPPDARAGNDAVRVAPAAGVPGLEGLANGARPNKAAANGVPLGAGRVNGGRVNGGRVNGGRVNGGRVNGGRVNGGRVNGGRVNGGRVNGGRVNGVAPYPSAVHAARWRRSRQTHAVVVAALLVAVALLVPLLGVTVLSSPAIVIDGDFSDWSSVRPYPDAVSDQAAGSSVNIVGYAAVADDEALYLYAQTVQGSSLFASSDGSSPIAHTLRVLIDSDRSASTGFSAFGLGADFLVEVSGDSGSLRTTSLKAFAGAAADRADPSSFFQTGAVRAAFSLNQLEVAVPLSSLRAGPVAPRPFLLLLAQDSDGHLDVSDVVFTTLPGAVSVEQEAEAPAVLPTDDESLLLTLRTRAVHFDMSLDSVSLLVEGDGGGVEISHLVHGAERVEVSARASAGETLTLPLGNGSSTRLSPTEGGRTLEVWGRAWGPADGAALRLVATPGVGVSTSGAPEGASGHISALPPLAFARSYVGLVPSAIRIDGAFADWAPWAPFDPDPAGDATRGIGGVSPNASNPAGAAHAAVDITASRALVEPAAGLASFYLETAGSIMGSQDLAPPRPPVRPGPPSAPGAGVPGGPGPLRGDTATLYVDTDGSPSTGWQQFPGMGIDAFARVRGAGGGWGRTPVAVGSTLGLWNATAGAFDERPSPLSVAFGSSKMEAQLRSDDLCGGPCGPVRYLFHLEAPDGGHDDTAAHDSSTRTGGERLLFTESAGGVRIAYQGDLHIPLLSFSVAAPSTNKRTVSLVGLHVAISGLAPGELGTVSLYRDLATQGIVDPDDLAGGPVAVGAVDPDGLARLALTAPVDLSPGAAFDGLVAVDIGRNATTPATVRASVAEPRGIRTAEPFETSYTSDTAPRDVRVLPYSPGSRGQNQVVINEMDFNAGWVELYHTLGTQVSLSSPSQMGIEIWRTNPPQNKYFVEQIVLVGSTDSSGYVVIDMDLIYSGGGRTYYLSLWCSNCSAGATAQGNNTTYVDSVELPTSTPGGMWGRYPNGNGSFAATTNNTQAAENQIPEFADLVVPLGATVLLVGAVRRARRAPA